jgi:hypothetical protein
MKITKTRLKEIIVEELQNVMGEMYEEDDESDKEYVVNSVKTFFDDRPNASGLILPDIVKNAASDLEAPLTMDDLKARGIEISTHPESGTPLLFVALKRAALGGADDDVILSLLKLVLGYQPSTQTTQMENKQTKITKARLKTIIMEELSRVMREQEFGGTFKLPTTLQAAIESELVDREYDQDDFDRALDVARNTLAELEKGEPNRVEGSYEYYEFDDDGDKQTVEDAFQDALKQIDIYRF